MVEKQTELPLSTYMQFSLAMADESIQNFKYTFDFEHRCNRFAFESHASPENRQRRLLDTCIRGVRIHVIRLVPGFTVDVDSSFKTSAIGENTGDCQE
jgi:hypothetical protein